MANSNDQNAAEIARIEKELAEEAKRQKWRSLYNGVPAAVPKRSMAGWLVARGLVRNENEGNFILIGVAIAALVVAFMASGFRLSIAPKTQPNIPDTPAQRQARETQTL